MSRTRAATYRPTEELLAAPRRKLGLSDASDLKHYARIDRKLFREAKQILVLKSLEWPSRVKREFLKGFRAGKPRLPIVTYEKKNYSAQKRALRQVVKELDSTHPIATFLKSTAESYLLAATMLENIQTTAFSKLSAEIYGHPADEIGWNGLSHLGAADGFVETTREIISSYCLSDQAYCLTPRYVAKRIRKPLSLHFKEHEIKVVLDSNLSSKACAGGKRIRLRARTPFSEIEIGQLINHEGFVHMLTMINGKSQPHLKCLGLAAPRTVKTQEGLATFAELITGTIDLHRLLRIALRTRAVNMGIEGADFLEVFRYFLNAGQSEEESFQSARRIFRGGDPRGKVVFTKDVVYLQGLILTHTFLRKAVERSKFYLAQHLFSGRLALGDTILLEPFFASGYIAPPSYLPPWVQTRECFAAHLCYYVFANQISLSEVRLKDFFEF